MQDLQSRMLAAVLRGEGLRGVAELAAGEAGAPVAIVLPARGLIAAAPLDQPPTDAVEYVTARVRGDPAPRPACVDADAPVLIGEDEIGAVLGLAPNGSGAPPLPLDRGEVLRLAALATLAEVAAADARDELAESLRGGLLEGLRSGELEPEEATRRAARLGCDLSGGAFALVTVVRSAKPRQVAALIASEFEGAIAEPLSEERVYALLPVGADREAGRAAERARRLAGRLRPHGLAGFSSRCDRPDDLGRAISEAELALAAVAYDERIGEQLLGGIPDGTYRLLFRALASNPDEVRDFYEDTVAVLVAHDEQYRTDLLGTLEAYLANDCNINATARAVYAHRHTIAHRLQRIRELTGLDPVASEDRERLGLGVKSYRILAPTLPH